MRPATRRFGRNRRGNIAVTFALVCVPLVYVIGCAVDCTRVAELRRQLQAAANAASSGSVAKIAPGLLAAFVMTSDGPVAVGAADAADIFHARMFGVTGYTLDRDIGGELFGACANRVSASDRLALHDGQRRSDGDRETAAVHRRLCLAVAVRRRRSGRRQPRANAAVDLS
jgi:hypothetical protein